MTRLPDSQPMLAKDSAKLCIAVITGVHGIKGHVKIKTFNEMPQHLNRFNPLTDEVTGEEISISRIVSTKGDMLVAALEGVNDRNLAETFKGHPLVINRSRLPETSEDEFYYSDLAGLKIQTLKGQSFGTVIGVYNFGGGDMLEVKRTEDGKNEFLLFTKKLFPTVDLKAGVIHMDLDSLIYVHAKEGMD